MKEMVMREETAQELADSGKGPSSVYILKNEDRHNFDTVQTAPDIPVIHIGHAHECDPAEIMNAVQSWGLFQVISDDFPQSLLDEVREVSRKFFQLPMEEKMKSKNSGNDNLDPFGYGNFSTRYPDQIVDWNDRLYIVVQPEDKRNPKHWPEQPTNFGETIHEYSLKTKDLADIILSALAKMLEIEEDYFVRKQGDGGEVYARFNNYPQCTKPDLVSALSAHADGSLMTILLPDDEVEGLQVLRDGKWFKVPIVPNALVVNMGYEIQILSNGNIKSPVHRVSANGKQRISVTMFSVLNPEMILEPAKGLVDEQRPCLYRKMKTKDFIKEFFEKFAQGVTSIEWAEV